MKILVIYATAGAGHRKAAEAIYNGLQNCPEHASTLVDALDYTSRFYKHSYSTTYTFLISKIPRIWGILFGLLDVRMLLPVTRGVRRVQNFIHAQALERYLKQEQFDCVISTHFFPNEVVSHLKKKGAISSRLICAVTDYDVHTIWLASGVDQYAVASDWTKHKMFELQGTDENVHATGIPSDKKFSQDKDIGALKEKLGLKHDVTTVLVATGSFGIGPIEEIIEALPGFQVIVVCGHNKSLYEKLSQQQKELVKICGLVDNMDELMAVSDIMVTKPGGLSITEALVTGLPLVFFNAIPGQETNNIRVLKEYGVGISDCGVEEIATILREYQSSPEKLHDAKQKAHALAQPQAVENIIGLITK